MKAITSYFFPPETDSFKPVDRTEQPLHLLVGQVAFKIFYWTVWSSVAALSIALVIPAAIVITKRASSHLKMKETIRKLAENRYDSVKSHLNPLKSSEADFEKLDGDEHQKDEFCWGVVRLLKIVDESQVSYGNLHERMQAFREQLDTLLAHPVYQQNKGKKDNFFIKVLQDSAHALVAESPGMGPMQELGKKVVKDLDSLTYGSLASTLDEAVKSHAEFRKSNLLRKIFWSFSHPEKTLASLMDATGIATPISYNSYRHGNASMQIGEFRVGKTTYSLSQAPTFTCDRMVEAARDRGDKRIVFDVEEENGPKGERGRVQAKKAASDETLRGKGGRIYHVHTPIDIHKGMTADSSGLSESLVKAVDSALAKNEPARAVAFAALKALQTMDKQARNVSGTVYINQSCKQNIDRGVVVNVASILFADAISKKKLTKERVHQIVGMVLTRPEVVDDRAILKNRLTPLLDLIKVMDDKFIAALRKNFRKIAFNASDR